MKRLLQIYTLLVFLLCPACLWAEYTATELFIIGWGDGPDEFLVRPSLIDDQDTPENPNDDKKDSGAGPHKVFIDSAKNCIFMSTLDQIKGFTKTGKLIFEISNKFPNVARYGLYRYPSGLYVDSSSNIFVTFVPSLRYIPVIAFNGAIIDSLIPFGKFAKIRLINWTYSGDLMFFSDDYGWSTYSEGEFRHKGASGVVSAGGEFHDIEFIEPNILRFSVYTDPDEWGWPKSKDPSDVEIDVDFLAYVELLNSKEPEHLYVLLSFWDKHIWHELWIYDLEYNLVDKIGLWSGPMYYDLCPYPFITSDGDIYEFRCLEDGMHIIRWSEK